MPDTAIVSWVEMKYKFLRRYPNPNTYTYYSLALREYRKHLEAYDPTLHPLVGEYRQIREAIEDWTFSSGVRHKAGTVKSRLSVVYTFYEWLIAEDIIELVKNPARKILVYDDDLPHRPRFPDADLADRLELCFRKEAECGKRLPVRDWLMFRFLTEGGFRAGELCNLKLRDVDVKTSRVTVVRAKRGKARVTAVLPETCEALAEFAEGEGLEPEDFLFMPNHMYNWMPHHRIIYKYGSRPVSKKMLTEAMKRVARRNGFEPGEVKQLQSQHGYRHLWAVRHIAAGTVHTYVMLMGGWKDYRMLDYYINYAAFEIQAVERKVNRSIGL